MEDIQGGLRGEADLSLIWLRADNRVPTMARLTRLLFSGFNRMYYEIIGGDSQLFLVLSLGEISVYTFYTYTYGLDESGSTAQALLSESDLNIHNIPTQPRPYSRFHGIIKQAKKDMTQNMTRRRTAPDNAQPIPETLPASVDRCTGLCLGWLATTRIAESK